MAKSAFFMQARGAAAVSKIAKTVTAVEGSADGYVTDTPSSKRRKVLTLFTVFASIIRILYYYIIFLSV